MDIIDQNLVVRDWPLKEPGDEAFFGYVVAFGVFPRNGQGNYFFGYVDFFYRDHYFRYRLPKDKNLINELLEHFAMNMETVLIGEAFRGIYQSGSRTTDRSFPCMTDLISPEDRFVALARDGRNCFLTGMAGTGKSTLLREFINLCPRKVDVTAPTGVAALNVSGMTIHRFCGMLLGPAAGQSDEEYFDVLRRDTRPSIMAGFNRVRRCETLVIDEISMLPGRQLDFVEYLFRRLRGRDEPFGGCQVIVTGDFLQLPPVRSGDTEPYDWAFLSRAWREAGFKTILLETVRRQDEPAFVQALGEFREGRVWGTTARLLQSRVKNFPPANLTRLFTHNVQVDKWNDFQLAELAGDAAVLEAEQSGPDTQRAFLTKNLLTPATLRLKLGALVMFTVNKNERGQREPVFVNGQMGTVSRVESSESSTVTVRLRDGREIEVERFTWRFSQNDPDAATFAQFPLRLAYAMTIHKSQGLTLDAAYLDIRAAREPGQAYVAVSRVRTLAGLHFKDWFKGLHVSPEAIEFYRNAL